MFQTISEILKGIIMKFSFMFASVFSTALSVTFLSTQTFASEFYKWVDANGSTHYTKTPPPKNAKKKGKVETFGVSASTQVTTHQQSFTPQNQETARTDVPQTMVNTEVAEPATPTENPNIMR